jgi:hypothetical protein
MQCQGKCQLSKKMASDSADNKKSNGIVKEKSTEVLYFEIVSVTDSGFEEQVKRNYTRYLIDLHPSPTFDIFHPPS